MKAIKTISAHILFIIAGFAVTLLIPFLFTDTFQEVLAGGEADAATSASVIVEQPAGEYYVFLNKTYHTDKENLAEWIRFFSGEEISYIFEDISCSAAKSDIGALEMSDSFRSRLPENQMQVKTEDPILLASRAENEKFDVIIMSAEFAEAYGVDTESDENVEVIRVVKAEESEDGTEDADETEEESEDEAEDAEETDEESGDEAEGAGETAEESEAEIKDAGETKENTEE